MKRTGGCTRIDKVKDCGACQVVVGWCTRNGIRGESAMQVNYGWTNKDGECKQGLEERGDTEGR